MEGAALKALIRRAFDGVSLGDGIGLRQADAIDGHKSAAEQAQARQRDEKEDWSALSRADLHYFQASLSFFDAAGMRFHIAPFMLAEIDGEGDAALFHLKNLDAYSLARFTLLTPAQRAAVIAFLQWCLANPLYAHDAPAIGRALDEYWRPA